jgi:hypothetical protein
MGIQVLLIGIAIYAGIWALILTGSQFFGPR